MSEKIVHGSLPPSPLMGAVGLSFIDVVGYARTAVDLIREHGHSVVDALEAGFKAFAAISNRDLVGFLAALSEAKGDIEKVIAAIRDAFDV
jgi:hypothetical protein